MNGRERERESEREQGKRDAVLERTRLAHEEGRVVPELGRLDRGRERVLIPRQVRRRRKRPRRLLTTAVRRVDA